MFHVFIAGFNFLGFFEVFCHFIFLSDLKKSYLSLGHNHLSFIAPSISMN